MFCDRELWKSKQNLLIFIIHCQHVISLVTQVNECCSDSVLSVSVNIDFEQHFYVVSVTSKWRQEVLKDLLFGFISYHESWDDEILSAHITIEIQKSSVSLFRHQRATVDSVVVSFSSNVVLTFNVFAFPLTLDCDLRALIDNLGT